MASNTSYDRDTSALEVAKAYSSKIKGKTVLITGVSPGGIGDGTARAFAHGGASTIIITGRNDTRLSESIKALSAAYPSVTFRPLKLDLDSLKDVKQSAEELLNDEEVKKIDILVANAGANIFGGPRQFTKDGLEWHFGANHLAHFYFVTLLLPLLRAAAKQNPPGATRVVMLSSMSMAGSPIRFSDYNWEGKPVPEDEKPDFTILTALLGVQPTDEYEANVAYGQSKTANTLMALHLNTLFDKEGINAFSVHPGLVESTGAKSLFGTLEKGAFDEALKAVGPMKTIDQGSSTTIVAAVDPGLKPENGVYLADCQMAEPPAWASNKQSAERLWELSEKLVKDAVGA